MPGYLHGLEDLSSTSKAYSFHRVGSLCRCLSGNKEDSGCAHRRELRPSDARRRAPRQTPSRRKIRPRCPTNSRFYSTKSPVWISDACVPKGGTEKRASGPLFSSIMNENFLCFFLIAVFDHFHLGDDPKPFIQGHNCQFCNLLQLLPDYLYLEQPF